MIQAVIKSLSSKGSGQLKGKKNEQKNTLDIDNGFSDLLFRIGGGISLSKYK